jgi:hypothetical protein
VRTSGRKSRLFAGLCLAPVPSADTLHVVERPLLPADLETTIREISRELQELAVTPHIRELRAKAVTYGRVIGNWSTYSPTPPQVQAMLECVAELREKVTDAKRDLNREVSRVTRRQTGQASDPAEFAKSATNAASSRKAGHAGHPPPPHSSLPPALTWNASIPDRAQSARTSSRPPSRNEAPTRPPPPDVSATLPPISAPRPIKSPTDVKGESASDAPTPAPALLRSRRTR